MADNIPSDILQAHADGRIPEGISLEYLAENRDRAPIIAIIFVCVLTSIIVLLRLYGRLFLVRRFGLDDILAFLAWAFYIVFVVLSIILLDLGSGRHMEYIMYVLTMPKLSETEVLDFVGHIIYAVQLYLARMSGLAFYWRLSDRHHALQLAIKAGAVFITAATLPQVFLIIFHCLPVTALWPYPWQEEFKDYECMAWGVIYTTNSALSLVCDFVVFAIPVAMIARLHVSTKSKIKLSFILFPGVLVIAISIARIYLVVRGGWDADGSWFYSPQLAVQNAELGGTLLALSVPGLKPLFGTLFDKIGGTHALSRNDLGTAEGTSGLAGSKSKRSVLGGKEEGWKGLENESNDSLLAGKVVIGGMGKRSLEGGSTIALSEMGREVSGGTIMR